MRQIPPAAIIYITSADNDLLLHESQITALKHPDVISTLIRCCTLAGVIPSFLTHSILCRMPQLKNYHAMWQVFTAEMSGNATAMKAWCRWKCLTRIFGATI